MCECYCADCRRFVARCFGVAAVTGYCFLAGCAINGRKKTQELPGFWFCLVFSAIKRCDKTYSVNYRLGSCGFFGLEISTRSVCVDNCPVCQCDSYFHYLILLWFGFGLVLSNEEGKRYLELPYPNKSGTHRIFRLVYKLGIPHHKAVLFGEPCKYSRNDRQAFDQS